MVAFMYKGSFKTEALQAETKKSTAKEVREALPGSVTQSFCQYREGSI